MAQGAFNTLDRLETTENELESKLDKEGSAASANKLATARKISISGAVTGAGNFDGSQNITITTKAVCGALLSAAGTRDAALSAGDTFTVPEYIVGSNTLAVYWNGLLAMAGTDANVALYQEVGTTGAASTTIKFNEAISIEDEIYVRVG